MTCSVPEEHLIKKLKHKLDPATTLIPNSPLHVPHRGQSRDQQNIMGSLNGHGGVEARAQGRFGGYNWALPSSPEACSTGKKHSPSCNMENKINNHPAVREGDDTSSNDNQTDTEREMSLEDRVSLIHHLILAVL
jgi:hypothetical protein